MGLKHARDDDWAPDIHYNDGRRHRIFPITKEDALQVYKSLAPAEWYRQNDGKFNFVKLLMAILESYEDGAGQNVSSKTTQHVALALGRKWKSWGFPNDSPANDRGVKVVQFENGTFGIL